MFAKSDVLDKVQSGDKEFNFQIEQLKSAYDQVVKVSYARRMVPVRQAGKFKIDIGPLANSLVVLFSDDGLMLARYQGFEKNRVA
jgi:hypothetical protein